MQKLSITIIFIAILFFSCGNKEINVNDINDSKEEIKQNRYYNGKDYMMLLTDSHCFFVEKSTGNLIPYSISKEPNSNMQYNKILKPFNPNDETAKIKWANQQWVYKIGKKSYGLKLIHDYKDLSLSDKEFYKTLKNTTVQGLPAKKI